MAKKTKRDDDIAKRPAIRKKLLDVFKDVDAGYRDQLDRVNDTLDYWDAWNCKLGTRQFYAGNSKIYVPIVKSAIRARRTRFVNQIFPQSGRYVEVTTHDGDVPHATMSLLDHYVRLAKLRTEVVPALVVNGDVEGHYHCYVSWQETTRHTVTKQRRPVEPMAGMPMEEFGHVEDMDEREVTDGHPVVEVLADADVIVLPVTADSPEEAIEKGGSVTILRRWTKGQVKQMIADGEFDEDAADSLLDEMSGKKPGKADTAKDLAKAAGVRTGPGDKHVVGYETWVKLKVDGEHRICRAYYGGNEQILGCKLNPYWCDLLPLVSVPVEKVSNVFKGKSLIADGVIDIQVFANDSINEGADTAHFSAMPIVMTDPEKNPRVGTMVLGLAAVWETSPKDTSFAQFPPLWKDCLAIVAECKTEIFQALGVNPSMMPQQTGKPKRNQAEVALEQQVDLLTTADAVTVIEEGVLTPILTRFAAYDHQFREDDILVRKFGEMGVRATMEVVEPVSFDANHHFRWFGVEASRNAAQIQQQIAGMNQLKSIPPQLYPGFRLDMTPLMTQLVENLFGPRLAPLVFKDMKSQLGLDPSIENEMLGLGFDVNTHEMDDDARHIQAHMAILQADVSGQARVHIQKHMMQMQAKQQAAQGPPKQPGAGGGGGTPPGAQPGQQRMKGPPGSINPDRMSAAGGIQMPRKT